MVSWAVITGAGTGIGAALATSLASPGLHVLAVGRRLEPLQAVTAQRPDFIHPLQGDISEPEVIEKISAAIPSTDSLLYLVQNAAVGVPSTLLDLKREDFEYALAVNVTAPLFLTQKLFPRLQESGGRVLHLGTGVANMPQLGTASYGVSKMAFHRLYEQLKVEFDGTGVSVGSVRPGVVDTEGLREHEVLATKQGLPHAHYFSKVREEGSMGEAQVAAQFIKFLLMETGREEFSAKEWSINDEEHWDRWRN